MTDARAKMHRGARPGARPDACPGCGRPGATHADRECHSGERLDRARPRRTRSVRERPDRTPTGDVRARRVAAAGFTMVELVITVAVLGVIAGVFVHYVDEGTRMFEQVDARREMTAEARGAMLRLLREIRQVRSATDVLVATPTRLQFVGVDDSTYAIDWSAAPGAPLTFARGATSVALVAAVDSFALDYRREDDQPAAPLVAPSPTDVRRVGVYLRLRSGGHVVALRSGTWLRNVP